MHNRQVPETLEGWSVLHQMFRLRWETLLSLPADRRRALVDEAAAFLSPLEGRAEGPSALVQLLGHKGDLMLVHFRKTFDELAQVELTVQRLGLARPLEATTSYVSIVELGLYEITVKIHEDLKGRGHRA